jgi:hypothetical protein
VEAESVTKYLDNQTAEQFQLLRYLANSSSIEFNLKQLLYYHFSVNIVYKQCYVIFRLNDDRNVTLQIGGASFRSIVLNEWRLYSCPYVDYTNGTYDVICKIYDNYHDITIRLMFLDFGAFRWDGFMLNETVWQG